MRKTVLTFSAVAIGAMALSGPASAAVLPALQKTQWSTVFVCATTTTMAADYTRNCPKVKGNKTLKSSSSTAAKKAAVSAQIDAYLATRYTNSTNVTLQGNPVGKVVMDFPTNSLTTPANSGKPNCNQHSREGAAVIANCAASLIGTGWALVNTGQGLGEGGVPSPRPQLDGAPAACAAESGASTTWNMYKNTYEATGKLPCVPWSHLYNKVRVYQGGIPYDVAGNKKGTKVDSQSVIFVSQNVASIVSFDGQIKNNRLTVNLPALYGTGSYAGELLFGWTLTDFRVILNQKGFFKVGACPASGASKGKVTTKSAISFSKQKMLDGLNANGTPNPTEDNRAAPATANLSTVSPCS